MIWSNNNTIERKLRNGVEMDAFLNHHFLTTFQFTKNSNITRKIVNFY